MYIDNLANIIFIAMTVFMLVMTLILFIASCIQNKLGGKDEE